jgi:hypothetical protein
MLLCLNWNPLSFSICKHEQQRGFPKWPLEACGSTLDLPFTHCVRAKKVT